jgi:uncharacterized membrane protein
MESRTKFLGHPIHPMLIVFPLGLLIASVIFDILFLITENLFFSVASFYNISFGILMGLVAAIFGFIDYRAIPSNTRAKRVGAWHGVGNVILLLFFSFSWFMRYDVENHIVTVFAMLTSLFGLAVGTITGWLGGELVYRHSVAVDEGAHLNSPSSLKDYPASADADEIRMNANPVPVTGRYKDDDEPDDNNEPSR